MPRKHLAAHTEENRVRQGRLDAQMVNRERAMRYLTKLLHCERAASAIEYGLVGALISIAAFAAMTNLGNKTDQMFNNVSNHLN
jgi:pilus assembly protein Flp/PilA